MAGRRPPKHDILIPPEGVVARRSTDMEAIENPYVAAAMRLIREHLGEPFGVKVLEKHLAVSRALSLLPLPAVPELHAVSVHQSGAH